MILVDIEVPYLGICYDFELDQEAKAGELIEKILSLVQDREKIGWERADEMELAAFGGKRLLKRELSLAKQGIKDGHRLILL